MSDFFRLEVGGAHEVLRMVTAARVRAQNIDNDFPIIAELMHAAVNDVVAMEGPGWPALAEATLARRRKHGRGAAMLVDTGLMMASLDEGVGPDYAQVHFGVPYAIHHIRGKRNPFDLTPVEDGLFEDIKEVLLKGIV